MNSLDKHIEENIFLLFSYERLFIQKLGNIPCKIQGISPYLSSFMNDMKKTYRIPRFLFIFILGLLLHAIIYFTTNPMGFGDSDKYLAMAQHPWILTSTPWGYRIAIPYLATLLSRLFSWELETSFRFITASFFASIITVCFLWLRRQEHLKISSTLLLIMVFTFSYVGGYNTHNYIHIGFAEHLLFLLGFIIIRVERFQWSRLFFLLFIGSVVKETIVLLIPLYVVYNWSKIPLKKLLISTISLISLTVLIFFFLRSGYLFNNSVTFQTYRSLYTMDFIRQTYHYWDGLHGACIRVLRTFGIFWCIAAIGFFYTEDTQKPLAVLIPLAVGQIVLATDVQRMTGIAFPAILFLASRYFHQLSLFWQFILTVIHVTLFYASNYYLLSDRILFTSCCTIFIVCFFIHIFPLIAHTETLRRVKNRLTTEQQRR